MAEEFSSDMRPQIMSDVFQKFLPSWGVHHRQSSAYFRHSNARAELSVKTGKRLLRDNTDNKGSLTTDYYVMSVLQSRNTPLADVRLSPAQIIFGRQLRDTIPMLANKYQPREEWCLLRESRERALARRIVADGSRLDEHVKPLQQIPVGI